MRARWTVSQWLGVIAAVLMAVGVLLIGGYSFSTPGPHVRFLGVGLLTALASLATGFLVGFLFGVPKVVSSGEFRLRRSQSPVVTRTATESTEMTTTVAGPSDIGDPHVLEEELEQSNPQAAGRGPHEAERAAAGEFTPSTNLSEVSDWLTKLLLGAGLVQLTQLGEPLGNLIGTIASGMEQVPTGTQPSRSALVVAGAILVAYFVLGFLCGYVVTTLWYGRRLREV